MLWEWTRARYRLKSSLYLSGPYVRAWVGVNSEAGGGPSITVTGSRFRYAYQWTDV